MNRGETDVERLIDTVAAGSEFASLTAEHDAISSFPWPIWSALVDIGLPSLELAAEDGGLDLELLDVVRALERLGYHSIAASTAYFTFCGFGIHVLSQLRSDHPLRSLLPKIAKGEVRTALSLTEANGGSDLSLMRTRFREEGESWRLAGTKMYTTLAEESTHLIVAGFRTRWVHIFGETKIIVFRAVVVGDNYERCSGGFARQDRE